MTTMRPSLVLPNSTRADEDEPAFRAETLPESEQVHRHPAAASKSGRQRVRARLVADAEHRDAGRLSCWASDRLRKLLVLSCPLEGRDRRTSGRPLIVTQMLVDVLPVR